jgi:arginase family enzyme
MIKIFGAAFDPLDLSERIDLKMAYLNWLKTHRISKNTFLDPYDFLKNRQKKGFLEKRYPAFNEIEWIGKFPIESWLRPKPSISDIKAISQKKYTEFLNNNGCYGYYNKLVDYLAKNMGSSIPVMVGVDHCLTGGVLRYLKEKYSDFNVLIFDSHCDMIDLETQKIYFGPYLKYLNEPLIGEDIYECGSFLCHLLNENIIKPENLWIMGTQDLDQFKKSAEPLYSKKILPWIKRGVHIISKSDLILSGIPDEIKGQTYISFDMDLGSLSSVFATRFLNYIGLNVEQILGLIHKLSEKIRTRKIELVGLDIMEVDIHFLGANIGDNKDRTDEIMSEIIDRLIYRNFLN